MPIVKHYNVYTCSYTKYIHSQYHHIPKNTIHTSHLTTPKHNATHPTHPFLLTKLKHLYLPILHQYHLHPSTYISKYIHPPTLPTHLHLPNPNLKPRYFINTRLYILVSTTRIYNLRYSSWAVHGFSTGDLVPIEGTARILQSYYAVAAIVIYCLKEYYEIFSSSHLNRLLS